jgi:hypothetical protein
MNKEQILVLKLPGSDTEIEGPKGEDGLLSKPDLTLADIINKGIELVFFAAGLALFAYLLYGGFKFLTSLGDEQKVAEAKGTITNALLGFGLIFAAFFITKLFGSIFGIEIF